MRLLALVIYAMALLLAAIYGGFIAGIVLREPDVCFLLAMGRWMIEHGQIPAIDPFSATYLAFPNGNTYVVYQWLYELILYGMQKLSGAAGVLVVSSVVLVITSFVIPLRFFAFSGANMAVGAMISMLALVASVSHPSVRPEMVSFLFTAILLEQLAHLARRQTFEKIDWRLVIVSFIFMVLWTNLHCMFIYYFIQVGFFAACLIGYAIYKREKIDGRAKTALAALTAGGFASLINPYCLSLWPFTFRMLSDPINKTINELKPLSPAILQNPLDYPWMLLALIAVIVFLFSLRHKITSGSQLYFLLLIPAAIAMSFLAVRTFPMAALLMCCGMAAAPFFKISSGWLERLGKNIAQVFAPRSAVCLLAFSIFAGSGSYLISAYVLPPTVPLESAFFKPPFAAIKYLQENKSEKLAGNLLNDAHYGAVMMWQMQDSPKVFVDPRYFLYNVPLMNDYWDMVLYRNNPEAKLDQYKISWVFMPAATKLVKNLSTQPQWTTLYSDKDAAILVRDKWQTERGYNR